MSQQTMQSQHTLVRLNQLPIIPHSLNHVCTLRTLIKPPRKEKKQHTHTSSAHESNEGELPLKALVLIFPHFKWCYYGHMIKRVGILIRSSASSSPVTLLRKKHKILLFSYALFTRTQPRKIIGCARFCVGQRRVLSALWSRSAFASSARRRPPLIITYRV